MLPFLLISSLLFLPFSQAGNLTQFFAHDGAASDKFGSSVATSGSLVAVGAKGDASTRGSASVYSCLSFPCSFVSKLTASDGEAGDYFGYAIGISGSLVVVGAYLDGVGANPNQGSAYIFSCSSSSCTQEDQLLAPDGAATDNFGSSVAISGSMVVVGAPNRGAAYVYSCPSFPCSFVGKLTATDAGASDQFGNSVAISGSLVVVGATRDFVGANENQGSAFVFSCSPSSCTQEDHLLAPSGKAYAVFGSSVAISGTMVAVGAQQDDSFKGSAYIYSCPSFPCTFVSKLSASDITSFAYFGSAVAISGSQVLVGAYVVGSGAGAAYLFTCSSGSCSQTQKITREDLEPNDLMGFSVAVDGDLLAIGVPNDMVGDNVEQGSAVVYSVATPCPSSDLNGQNWPETPLSTNVTLSCPIGYSAGTTSRLCQADGNWAAVQGECILIPTCLSSFYGKAQWPSTSMGTTASGTCQTGYSGSPLRVCKADATWATLISNPCTQNRCAPKTEFNANWPLSTQGEVARGTCLTDFVGAPTRICLSTGVYASSLSGSCLPSSTTCQAEAYGNANWPGTLIGTDATGTCLAGYSGAPQRRCKVDGTWETLIRNHCVKALCPAQSVNNTDWPQSPQNTRATGTCTNTYIGAPTRFCNSLGQWQAVQNPCRPFGTCPGEIYNRATWQETQPGATALGVCIDGWAGTPNRICKADGTWQTLVRNLCTRI